MQRSRTTAELSDDSPLRHHGPDGKGNSEAAASDGSGLFVQDEAWVSEAHEIREGSNGSWHKLLKTVARWGDYPLLMRGAEDLGVGKVNRGTNSEVRETVFEATDERTICVRIFMSVIDLAEVEIDWDLTCMPRMRWKCGQLLGLHINYTLLVLEISLIIYIFWDWKSVAASDRHKQMHFLFVLLWLLCCKFLVCQFSPGDLRSHSWSNILQNPSPTTVY